jgi:MFS family permease
VSGNQQAIHSSASESLETKEYEMHQHGIVIHAPRTDRRQWGALALVVTAQFMVILDVAIVNVALPSIKSDLGFSGTSLQWVVSAYAIVFGGTLLLGGRLADLLGRRRVFISGLILFAASSLLCGLAWSEGSLIAFSGGARPWGSAACAGRSLVVDDDLRRRP